MDLVRRQLARDYEDRELEERGLEDLHDTRSCNPSRRRGSPRCGARAFAGNRPALEGAVVVTSPQTAEVRALVGGKQVGFDGFNRALDAKRQIGSLIKPVVYLAALESGRHSLATQLDDEPITVELDDGQTWSPRNFDEQSHGQVTAVRALAESLNLATVHLGFEVGLARVARMLERLGVEYETELYPSLLLGAIELTPYEVTQLYNTLANGGFRVPLARRSRGGRCRRQHRCSATSLAIEEVADPVAVYALNQGLVQVMERGTGRPRNGCFPGGLRDSRQDGNVGRLARQLVRRLQQRLPRRDLGR